MIKDVHHVHRYTHGTDNQDLLSHKIESPTERGCVFLWTMYPMAADGNSYTVSFVVIHSELNTPTLMYGSLTCVVYIHGISSISSITTVSSQYWQTESFKENILDLHPHQSHAIP